MTFLTNTPVNILPNAMPINMEFLAYTGHGREDWTLASHPLRRILSANPPRLHSLTIEGFYAWDKLPLNFPASLHHLCLRLHSRISSRKDIPLSNIINSLRGLSSLRTLEISFHEEPGNGYGSVPSAKGPMATFPMLRNMRLHGLFDVCSAILNLIKLNAETSLELSCPQAVDGRMQWNAISTAAK
ncbi:hypothetical protein K474DRAFT_655970 [Panus rudis PR-1116 ss-1]|nr:hypothetical protein K474DRAFT_655970 [Panus rudis PR-1116 ss-1]